MKSSFPIGCPLIRIRSLTCTKWGELKRECREQTIHKSSYTIKITGNVMTLLRCLFKPKKVLLRTTISDYVNHLAWVKVQQNQGQTDYIINRVILMRHTASQRTGLFERTDQAKFTLTHIHAHAWINSGVTQHLKTLLLLQSLKNDYKHIHLQFFWLIPVESSPEAIVSQNLFCKGTCWTLKKWDFEHFVELL